MKNIFLLVFLIIGTGFLAPRSLKADSLPQVTPTILIEEICQEQITTEVVTIQANNEWQPTPLTLQPEDAVQITYQAGDWRSHPNEDWYGPNGGSSYVCGEENCQEPLPFLPKGQLIGQIGASEPFSVGAELAFISPEAGVLNFRMNDPDTDDNDGNLEMEVRVSRLAEDCPEDKNPRVGLFTVWAAAGWQSTDISLKPEQVYTITYESGRWRNFPTDDWHNVDGGASFNCCQAGCVEPLPCVPQGALIGRVNEGEPFYIGESYQLTGVNGVLALRMNDMGLEDNQGALTVKIYLK